MKYRVLVWFFQDYISEIFYGFGQKMKVLENIGNQ